MLSASYILPLKTPFPYDLWPKLAPVGISSAFWPELPTDLNLKSPELFKNVSIIAILSISTSKIYSTLRIHSFRLMSVDSHVLFHVDYITNYYKIQLSFLNIREITQTLLMSAQYLLPAITHKFFFFRQVLVPPLVFCQLCKSLSFHLQHSNISLFRAFLSLKRSLQCPKWCLTDCNLFCSASYTGLLQCGYYFFWAADILELPPLSNF